jgi:hypothetical protein
MHLLIWILAFIALALWIAAAWGVSALLGMDPDWVEGLRPALKGWPGTAWMEIWLPGWKDLLLSLLDLSRALLGWAGTAGQWVLGLVWGLGALLIVGAGVVLSLLVGLGRKAAATAASAAASASAASAQTANRA